MLSVRSLLLFFFLIFLMLPSDGQPQPAETTVKNYTLAQKRLLMVSTQQYMNYLAPGLDQDSLLSITCRITRQPFLLFFNEGFENSPSPGASLIDAGKPEEAAQLLTSLRGTERTQLLMELALWHLHRTGAYKADLDRCESYLSEAAKLAARDKDPRWRAECDFILAELHAQRGDTTKARELYTHMMAGDAGHDPGNTARLYQCLGKLLPDTDTLKPTCFKSALEKYHSIRNYEKEIDVLGDIVAYYCTGSGDMIDDYLLQIHSLQRSIGFRHTLFVQSMRSYGFGQRTDYLKALECANDALENMKWAGMDAVVGSIYFRIANVYAVLGKYDEAVSIFKKALALKSLDTQIFWYKNVILMPELLFEMHRPGEALTLLTGITDEYPPRTTWQKMQVTETKGRCYEKLGSLKMADRYYMDLFNMALQYPEADIYGELSGDYAMIALYYASQRLFDKARLFLRQSLKFPRMDKASMAFRYLLLFRIDSANNNYRSALRNYIQYKLCNDSSVAADQRKKFDEVTIKYAAEKKDKDIRLLQQQTLLQQSSVRQNRTARDLVIAGSIILLLFLILLYNRYRIKQRANTMLEARQKEINEKNIFLQHIVEEKEWLLKEVHHRVKNNLHTVICLLESQAEYLESDALKALEVVQRRIFAMSLIHQKLYQSEEIKAIDMSVYIPEFIQYLEDSFGVDGRLTFRLDISPVTLGLSQAIPVALIINEAVTNAIKHAFPGNKRGGVFIFMHRTGDRIALIITDDGIGIDPAAMDHRSGTLGLKLIKGLSEDIDATVHFTAEHGTRIEVFFSVDPIHMH